MKKIICLFGLLSLVVSSAHATKRKNGFCYKQADKYKDLMHKQVVKDLPEGVKFGEETLAYSQKRYALDNFAETYTFTIPAIGPEGDVTDLTYSVKIETWIRAHKKTHICDVLDFTHSKQN